MRYNHQSDGKNEEVSCVLRSCYKQLANVFSAYNHISDNSTGWRTLPCKVRFTVFIPENLNEHPYIAFSSHGKHVHPPPPPTKTPAELIRELNTVIEHSKQAGLTAGETNEGKQMLTSCNADVNVL